MFCRKCGKENSDEAKFCADCGEKLVTEIVEKTKESGEQAEAPVEEAAAETVTEDISKPVYTQPTEATGPVAILKKIGSSSLFLTMTILNTVIVFLSVFASNSGIRQLYHNLLKALYTMGVDNEVVYRFERSLYSIGPATFMYSLFLSVFAILVCIGLWICYVTAKNKAPIFKTGGLTLLKVVQIISLVSCCLLMLLVIVIFAITAIVLSSTVAYYGSDMVTVWIALAVTAFITLILMLIDVIFFAKIVTSLSSAIKTARTNKVVGNASAFVGIFLFISAFFEAFKALFTLITPALGIRAIINCAFEVIAGIVIFKYRKEIKMFKTKNKID
ncbi:MAG: zinc ribbon domain-containing protein [Clostridia bacterium]|nr:zinc ribbon domain-containing protein [Clostridia bacterium]